MRSSQLLLNNLGGLGTFSLLVGARARPAPQDAAVERRDTGVSQSAIDAAPTRRGLFDRLNHWLWIRQQREVEAYLAKATDVYDLEARIRALERNAPHPYY